MQNGGKTPAPKKKPLPPTTQGESLGRMIKKGDYSGAVKEAGESLMGAPKELYGALKRAAKFQAGGKMTEVKRYKDSQGRTYVINSQGQKIFDGVPVKKPVPAKASTPAAKAAAPKSNNTPKEVFMTDGERLGSMLKKGDYKGAANMFGEAITGAPKELYRAFTKNMESGGKMKSPTKSYKGPKGRK